MGLGWKLNPMFSKCCSQVCHLLSHLSLDTPKLTLSHTFLHPNTHSPMSVKHSKWLLHPNIHPPHPSSTCPGTHHSHAGVQHFHIRHSSLQSQSCITHPHDLTHATCYDTQSRPVYAPTEFSPPFIQYYGLKFIVQSRHIPQAIVAHQQVLVIYISILLILIC